MANTNLNLTTLRPTIKVRQRSGALEPVSPVTLKTTLGGGASQLGQLTDVTLTDAVGDNIIAYSNTTNQWVNRTPTSVASANTGQVVVSNTSNFDYTVRLANTVTVNNLVVVDTLTVANLQAASLSYTDLAISGNLSVVDTTSTDVLTAEQITANNVDITGDVTISGGTLGVTATTTFDGPVVINANLTVTGNTTYINTSELNVGDNYITLNSGVGGFTEPSVNAGIIINRGAQQDASFFWSELHDRWEIGTVKSTGNIVFSDGSAVIGVLDSVVNTSLNYVVTANTAKYLNERISQAYSNAAGHAANASYMTTGVVSAAVLPGANTTGAGVVRLVDDVANTSVTLAPTANAMKRTYDAAVTAQQSADYALSKVNGGTVNGAVIIANTLNVSDQSYLGATRVAGKLTVNSFAGDHEIGGNVNFSSNSLFVDTTNKRIGISTNIATAPLTIGQGGSTLTTPVVQVTETQNSYIQVAIQNISNGESASADYVITADTGTDITNYIDMGKASSRYNYPDFSFAQPLDGYLLNLGGNLNIAQGDPGKIQFFVGGSTNAFFSGAFTSDYANTFFVNGAVIAVSLSANLSGTDITRGTVPSARLPIANTTAVGGVLLLDSVSNTSIVNAPTANAVKRAYDLAVTANSGLATAYSNAVSVAAADATSKADAALANAYVYSANASNISGGTLPAGRLPAFTGGSVVSSLGSVSLSIANSGVTANTYGNTTTIPVIAVGADGRITAVQAANVASVNAITYSYSNSTLKVNTSDAQNFYATIDGAANFTVVEDFHVNTITQGAIPFSAANSLISGNAANFSYYDSVEDTFSGNKFNVGARTDVSATDTINLTYQIDSYVPHSDIEAFTISQSPGFTVSTSRGTEVSPEVSVGDDFIGLFAAYAYTGSSPQYYETAGWRYYAKGVSASLGGEARLYTKRDNGSLTLAMTVDETQSMTITGKVIASNTTDASNTSTGAVVISGGVSIAKQLWVGGNSHIDGKATFNGDVAVTGNLVVSGTTTSTNVATIQVTDSIIQAAADNITDVVDIGFIGQYSTDGGATNNHTGIIRDSSTKKWYLFEGYDSEPAGNDLDISDASFLPSSLVTGNVEIVSTTSSSNSSTGALRVSGGVGVQGNVVTGGAFVGSGAGLSDIPPGSLQYSAITINASNNVVVSNSGVIGLGGTINIYSTDTFSTVTTRGGTTSAALTISNTLATGNVTVTGFVNASANVVGSRLVSTVADGTAPLVVTSTTKVTNLNADKLDDLDSTSFVRSDSTSSSDLFGLSTFTKTLTIGVDWGDTGIIGSDMSTGSYMIQLTSDDQAVGGSNNQIYTGMVSWYGSTTNDTVADEIALHRTGNDTNDQSLFLRTLRQSGGYIKLQISGTYSGTGTSSYTFKFRRII